MDLEMLALGIKNWVPLYMVKDDGMTYYQVYMPFRSRDKFTNVSSVAIQNLMVNEGKNIQRTPQMIPRVMVKI